MTAYTVSSGATSAGITLNAGDTLTVNSGGSADDTVVNNGGVEFVLAGGGTTGTMVRFGGIAKIDGGVAMSTTVSANGQIQISSGGVGSDTTLVFGGSEEAFPGGTAISTTVNNSSTEIVWQGGAASSTVVEAGGTLLQIPGGTVVDPIFLGGTEVTSGVAVLLVNGGVSVTPPGTTATNLVVVPNLPAVVLPGGNVYSAAIVSGAEMDVYTGGAASNVTVFPDATLGVFSGGFVISSLVLSGGLESVAVGGSVVSAAAVSGGNVSLVGGSGNLLLVSGAGGFLGVGSGGHATQITDQTGGTVLVEGGGQAVQTEVFPGARLIVSSGGGAEVSYINDSGAAFVFSGGLLSSFFVSSGGTVVLSGGESDFALVAFGGTEVVSSGGLAVNNQTYGNLIVSSGGLAEQSLAISSGNLVIQSGGVADAVEVMSGGYAAVSAGGTIDGLSLPGVPPIVGATISGAGTLIALSGATIGGGIVFSGTGGEYVTTNSTALTAISGFAMGDFLVAAALPFLSAGSATLDSSDTLTITQGGNSFTAQFDASLTGDTLAWTADPIAGTDIELVPTVINVVAPETASNLTIGPTQILNVNSGAGADDTVLNGGGVVNIFDGGATSFTLLRGGTQQVLSGGLADNTLLTAGFEVVSSGGVATGSVIFAGGTQSVLSGGLASGSILGEFGTPGGVEQVANGGSVIGAIINPGGTLVVAPGVTASGTTVNGGTEQVVSGAIDNATTINGGTVLIASGGTLEDPFVSAGLLFVSNGATVVSPDTALGGYVVVLPGAVVSGPIASGANVISTGALLLRNGNVISQGATLPSLSIPFQGSPEYVLNGGETDGSAIYNGGAEYVLGGVAEGTFVTSSGAISVGAGGTANNLDIGLAGEAFVASGGVLSGSVRFTGAGGSLVTYNPTTAGAPLSGFNDTDTLDAAGLPFGEAGSGTLTSGYVLTVSQGGQIFTAQFDASIANGTFGWSADGSGGTEIKVLFDTLFVSGAGNTSSGIVLSAGASVAVYSGGVTSDTVLNAGAAEYVSAGGTAIATNIGYNGDQYIYSGGVATGTVFNQGTQIVESGAVDSGTTVYNGSEVISSGGTAIGTTLVNGGGLTVLGGGTASGTAVNFQGSEVVSSGGTVVGATVIYGGNLYVGSGAAAISTTLSSGDNFTVSSGGTAIGTMLTNGAQLNILPGAIVSGTIVESGGTGGLGSGTSDTGTIVEAFGTGVVSGGTSYATLVTHGGLQVVTSGGVASNTVVASGGVLVVSGGGVAFSPDVAPGGEVIVLAGGAVSGVPTGGGLVVSSGVVEIAAGSGVITQGASLTGVSVGNQETEYVLSGGTTTGTNVFQGGLEFIDTGVATGTTLVTPTSISDTAPSTVEYVASGGVAIGTTAEYATVVRVASGGVISKLGDDAGGGVASISMGGTALDVTISSGGEYVFGGGFASNTVVNSGGSVTLFGGSEAIDTTINSGGFVADSEGAVISNTVISGGGNLDLAGGGNSNGNLEGTAYGTITFSGAGGVLMTEDAPGLNATVVGFGPGDYIALDAAIGATVTLEPGNVLSASGNGQNFSIQLDPSQDFSGDTFNVTSGPPFTIFSNFAEVRLSLPSADYRKAAGTVAPVTGYVHVNAAGTVGVTVSNTAAADGLSENLVGTLASVTGGIGIVTSGPTGEIAAGSSNSSSLQVGVPAMQAGTVTGTATVDLISDGGTGTTGIDGLGTTALAPQTVPVTIIVDNNATPVFRDLSGSGTFTPGATAYTINLGTVTQGSVPLTVDLGVLNNATGPADVLTGGLSAGGSSAFTNSGLASVGTLGAGQSDSAPAITLATGTAGTFSETITLTGTGSNPGGYSAALAKDTLTITGTVASSTGTVTTPGINPAVADIVTGNAINFGTIHVGASASETLDIRNAATGTAAALDASVQSVSGAATASGSFSGLAAGADNTASIAAGIDASTAGVRTGTVALAFVSDAGTLGTTSLAAQNVAVSGTVYREAAAALLPLNAIVHTGDPGTISLPVSNSDTPDGYSENLLALLTGTTGNIGIVDAGPTADIAAAETNTNTLVLGFSTAQSGTVAGSATVGLVSDGAGIDGLGQTTLTAQTVPVSIAVDNYATTALSSNGNLTSTGANSYTLNLGSATEGAAPLTAQLKLGNTATGTADWLDGGFSVNGSGQFANTGFGAVNQIASGTSAAAGGVSLGTGQTGVFSETIMLSPTDANAAGFSDALTAQSILVTGTIVAPTGTAQGDVHMVTFDGLHYDFQAVGSYVLTRSTVPGDTFQIQIETAADPSIKAVSITTEVAAQVGSDVVTFGVGQAGVVWVDGAPDAGLSAGDPVQELAGGQLTELSPTVFRLDWANGEALTVTDTGPILNTAVSLPAWDGSGSVRGLLGGDSGQANDFQLADGTVLRQPLSAGQVLGEFASAWQVTPSTSLLGNTPMRFIYPDGAGGGTILQATAAGQTLAAAPGVDALSDADGFGVTFAGSLADFAGVAISGFNARDVIDVSGVNGATATTSYAGSVGGGVLQLSDGTNTGTIRLSGQIATDGFRVTSDNHGGSLITVSS